MAKKNTHRPWTTEEVYLLDLLSQTYTAPEIAKRLKRPVGSVRAKANREGILLYVTHDRLTTQQLAKYLGVSRNTVAYWVKHGLKAQITKGPGEGRTGGIRHTYRIRTEDFAQFYRSNHQGPFRSLNRLDPDVVRWLCDLIPQ